MSELDVLVDQFEETADPSLQKRLLNKMMLPLIASQDIGDDKIQLVQSLADIIENKTRQLDHDSQNLDFGRGEEEEKGKEEKEKGEKAAKRKKPKEEDKTDEGGAAKVVTPGGKKVKKAAAVAAATTTSNKKSRGTARKTERERSASPPELANIEIDPDEPTYCLCDQVSYGEMIGCDNDLCPIEWFHFNCVQLSGKPKGKWFCPKCRGDKPTVMKPKAQFLKELEKFNKEKEDKLK